MNSWRRVTSPFAGTISTPPSGVSTAMVGFLKPGRYSLTGSHILKRPRSYSCMMPATVITLDMEAMGKMVSTPIFTCFSRFAKPK